MLKIRIPLLWRYILLIWLIATIFNLHKAYHIDDAFHLEAAAHIVKNPLRPMSGFINWDDVPKPMYQHNQPPLLFYIISLNQYLFGTSEIAMHFMMSIFTFFSLYYFFKLINLLNLHYKRELLFLFGFCPAFIINQNLMTDIPVLSIMLAMYYHLLKGLILESVKHYFIASLYISIGLLIKYSLLPFVLILFLTILFSRHFKNIFVVFTPVLILGLWSLWNKYEFGSIHILSRPKIIFQYKLIFDYLGTLGSMTLFSFLYAHSSFFRNKKSSLITLIFLMSIYCVIYFHFLKVVTLEYFLSVLFVTNGIFLLFILCYRSIQLIIKDKIQFLSSPSFVLMLGICGVSLFIILFAPFNATRHILIILPLILLFGHLNFDLISGKLRIIAIMILGILLAISDWDYADFYRDTAKKINIRNDTYWSFGHWGWKWYSRKAGMKIYSTTDQSKLKVGDFIMYPVYVPKQAFPNGLELDTVKTFVHQPSIFTYFAVSNARFYNSSVRKPSWTLSGEPYDIIYQFRIRRITKP
jgi:hypothetical protein